MPVLNTAMHFRKHTFLLAKIKKRHSLPIFAEILTEF